MLNYSIEKKGQDYIVCCDQQAILKLATQRQARKVVRDALALTTSQMLAPADAN